MKAHRIFVTAAAAMLVVGLISASAGAAPPSGTWTYTDTTPDPTVVQNDATQHCSGGNVPPGPADVNSHPFKAKRAGVLTLTAHNQADWAMEVRDSKGNTITGTDAESPETPENMVVTLRKGTYEVVYCNFAGEHEITVDYKFTFSKVRGG